jgi:hypothetical protein
MKEFYSSLPSIELFISTAMKNKLKIMKLKKIISTIFVFLMLALNATGVFAGAALDGLDTANGKAGFTDFEGGITTKIGTLIGTILSFTGVIFFGLVLWGGFKWMTARGDTKQVTDAKNIIIEATVGLIFILSAYALTNLVAGAL